MKDIGYREENLFGYVGPRGFHEKANSGFRMFGSCTF